MQSAPVGGRSSRGEPSGAVTNWGHDSVDVSAPGDRVTFSWQAQFPIVGPIAIKVIDSYVGGGEGKLEARVLSFPRSGSRDGRRRSAKRCAIRGAAWAPCAMAHNRELEWRELDAPRVEVAASNPVLALVSTLSGVAPSRTGSETIGSAPRERSREQES